MIIKGEIKTQTVYVKEKRLSYPLTDSQLRKLKELNYVWFLCTPDDKIYGSEKYSGRIYRIKADELLTFIENNGFKDKNNEYVKERNGIFWHNVPLSMLKLVGQIDKNKMIDTKINQMGISEYNQSNKSNWTKTKFVNDSAKMSKKGTIGEMLMKEYFESQQGVKTAQLQSVYNSIDVKINYEKKEI